MSFSLGVWTQDRSCRRTSQADVFWAFGQQQDSLSSYFVMVQSCDWRGCSASTLPRSVFPHVCLCKQVATDNILFKVRFITLSYICAILFLIYFSVDEYKNITYILYTQIYLSCIYKYKRNYISSIQFVHILELKLFSQVMICQLACNWRVFFLVKSFYLAPLSWKWQMAKRLEGSEVFSRADVLGLVLKVLIAFQQD